MGIWGYLPCPSSRLCSPSSERTPHQAGVAQWTLSATEHPRTMGFFETGRYCIVCLFHLAHLQWDRDFRILARHHHALNDDGLAHLLGGFVIGGGILRICGEHQYVFRS
jgi:hypothetical protein